MMNVETIKQEIRKLIEKYNRVVEEKRVSKYNEEMTKKDFILPLFRALGWNTEDSKEVTAEEKISKKRVDYGFRINGIPKFFLEAKSLKEDLNNPKFIEQAINYAWHKGCTWAVLTDFESVKIFNAEWKTSNPLQSHLKTIPCQEFLDRFNELWLLSRESFEQGLIDKEAEKWGKKTKKISVDKQLLADFTRFRELLSKNITKLNQNKNITEEDLDESIQRILDRLIFIRNCEDRELEAKTLISSFREWESRGRGQLIKSLREVFAYFDKQYNSKIFANHLCDSLDIENDVLHEVIEGLYYTKDKSVSYDFSAIEADVLGNIYEQYLGYILKKSEKRAKLTESHAHRKEQGIYYTPTYIVDYIVRNTLGELLKDKKVNVEKIRVLDPACGSGSFLIKAFDVLNEHYAKHDKNYSQTQLDATGTGTTYSKKLKILQNNIFGVDLDKQAVEIAQLNLLLKIAEKGHRLPLLQENIKCGNSLIDDPTIAGDKAFKWQEEFKEIMKEGGFDIVIGNPPYVNIYTISENEQEVNFYQNKFETAYKKFDLYVLFIEKAIKLLKEGGRFSFIVPDKWLYLPYGEKLRPFILKNCIIEKIVDLTKFKVFKDATNTPIIFILRKESNKTNRDKNKIITIKPQEKAEDISSQNIEKYFIPQTLFYKTPKNMFRIQLNEKIIAIIEKIDKQSIKLGDICYLNWGCRPVPLEKFYINKKLDPKHKPAIKGENVCRYYIRYDGMFLNYDPPKLYNPVFPELFERNSIVIRDVAGGKAIYATINDEHYYNPHTVINCILKHELADIKKFSKEELEKSNKFNLKYILGLINSKLTFFYFFNMITDFLHTVPDSVRSLPVIETSETEQKKVIALVDKMLSLNKCLNELGDKKTDERAKIEEEIKKTDAEIDELVYKIYGVTEEEKKIIEESLK